MAASNGDQVNLVVKWAGKEYPIDNLPLASTVQQLKSAIHGKTNVLPSRQKLLNLRFKGKAPSDDQCLNQMRLVNYLIYNELLIVRVVHYFIQNTNFRFNY